jgi:ADP-ribosyl-[dinitrogen reductase] hydrolase
LANYGLQCFDIGNLTRSVLGFWQRQLQKTGYHELKPGSKHARDLITSIQHAVNAGFSVEVGVKSSGEITYHAPRAGNGSLMRIVPVALIAKSDQRALTMARECSRTTHPHVICSDCCEIYVKIVRMALTGSSKEDLAAAMWKYAEDREIDSAITDALRQYKTFKDWTKRPETDIRSEGYVLYGLEIAFWALCCTNTFEEGAIKVINLGYDTDTNGAIYGGLAGAYYGFEAIPKRWLDKLRKKRVLEDTVKAMIAFRTGEDNCEGSPAKKKCV